MFSTPKYRRTLPGFDDAPTAAPPPVSIGVPVYNGADFLTEALESIQRQTFTDFELLISDNASTDATEEICRAAAANDARIRYDRLPTNLGAAANYNRLVHAARGEWFRWASHDDLIDANTLEVLVDHVGRAPRPVLAYTKSRLIDQEGAFIRDHEDRFDNRHRAPYRRLATVARRWSKCHPIFGLIDREQLLRTDLIGPYVGSDVTLLAQLAVLGEFHEVPVRTFSRRIHARSSRQGELTLDEVAEWFDTSSNGTSRLRPSNLVMMEIVRSLFASDLPALEKVWCSGAYCLTWEFRYARIRGGRIKMQLKERLAGTETT